MPFVPTQEVMQIHQQAHLEFSKKNGAATLAVLGAVLGVSLALTTSRSSARIKAVLLAGILSAAGGALLGFVLGQRNAQEVNLAIEPSMVSAILYHSIVWGTLSLLVQLAISLAHKHVDPVKCLVCGLVGGIIAALVYCVQAQQFFEFSNMTLIIPSSGTERLIWVAICSAGVALSAAVAGAMRTQKAPESATDATSIDVIKQV
jgi:glycopeptide antibiotics resistance protein